MSSKSSQSKKKKSDTSEEKASKKIKLPKSFIVRPHDVEKPKTISQVFVNDEILDALEIQSGSLVYIAKDSGEVGIIATIQSNVDILDTNIIRISKEYRNLGGILLGDRVTFVKYSKQPTYASLIDINLEQKDIILEGKVLKSLEKLLNEVGIIYPGLSFKEVTLSEDITSDVTIIDISKEGIESSIENLSLDGDNASNIVSDSVSPSFIFQKGKTLITLSKESKPRSSKYSQLPQMMTYDRIGGLSSQISLLKSTIELPLHNPTLFTDFGISPPRGILLHGPPGTGKTMLLRCVANESNAHVLSINGPSIVSKYLGETENAIREIFQEARKFQPSIIFIDEIDSLVPSRNSDDSGEAESRVVATMLTLMDGMNDSGKVVVVGATNRPNSIDSALRRPGRFDQEVEIGIPDAAARLEILRKQFERMNPLKYELNDDDLKLVASKTHGYVGADLTALCRESVMKTIKRGLQDTADGANLKLSLHDVEEALLDIRPSAMREIFLEMPKVYWSDIGGQEELKKKLIEVVQLPLEAADSFSNLGINAPKGVLLYGPPGCSKTLTAKALATESGLNFLAVKGPEIFNKYVGESEKTIREIFRKARAASPSIIFFDEIDAISGDRESSGTSASLNVLTTLLNELDGVEELKGVIVVAATNRPTEIDPALLRPGRLDRHIYISPPDFNARLHILEKKCSKFNLDKQEVDLNKFASLTDGCSGAEVALLCQEAGLAAIMENRDATVVHKRHFEHALLGISKAITPDMIEYYTEFSKKSGLSI